MVTNSFIFYSLSNISISRTKDLVWRKFIQDKGSIKKYSLVRSKYCTIWENKLRSVAQNSSLRILSNRMKVLHNMREQLRSVAQKYAKMSSLHAYIQVKSWNAKNRLMYLTLFKQSFTRPGTIEWICRHKGKNRNPCRII